MSSEALGSDVWFLLLGDRSITLDSVDTATPLPTPFIWEALEYRV